MAENMITIPVEEYADLIASRTKLHTARKLIANEHRKDVELFGSKSTSINSELIETALGYVEDKTSLDAAFEKYREKKECEAK